MMTVPGRGGVIRILVLVFVVLGAAAGFVWSGLYNVGADDQHTAPVYAALATLRERSIHAHARNLVAPDLSDPALVEQGAGNYEAMCSNCHLAPGMAPTELSRGLNPAPPAFAEGRLDTPAHHFWVIKHGIKASGMAAWGRSMDDRAIWGLVALVQRLPELDAAEYRSLVARSDGHSHAGGHDAPPGVPAPAPAPEHHHVNDSEDTTP